MNIVAIIAGAVIYAALFYAQRDDDDLWRWVCLLAITAIAMTTMRASEHIDGYDDGWQDGKCAVYKSLDANPSITVKHMPEDC